MEILFITNSCSSKRYDEICKKRTREMIDPQQKYFRLLTEGLVCHDDVYVKVMPVLPLSASSYPQRVFRHEYEQENGVEYDYVPFYNGRILRYITLFFSIFFNVLKWGRNVKDKDDSFLVTDPLMLMAAMPARIACSLLGIKTCALVTDVPVYVTYMRKDKKGLRKFISNLYDKIADIDTRKYDSYITLTESINTWVNRKNKPYTIVEGVADINDTTVSSEYNNIIMYAGGVYEMYGVKTLVDSFLRLNMSDLKLHVYGKGTYVDEINRINKEYGNVEYMGSLSPAEIVGKEKRALLLVNPRPCGEEFSKFSFPSKTMEYMLSGTPVVSTKLPGIPSEYFNYIYAFDSDTEDSIYKKLKELTLMDRDELRSKGVSAHNFVLENKNNVKMSEKIIELFKDFERNDKI